MFRILPQRAGDGDAVDALLDLAFGPGRLAKTSYRFRHGIADIASLRLVALEGGRVVGTIRFWPLRVGATATPALLLGPLAVCPHRRGLGIGRALIRRGLAGASAQGHELILLVGEAAYYAPFGFRPAAALGIHMAGEPERLLALALAGAGGASGHLQRAVQRPSRHQAVSITARNRATSSGGGASGISRKPVTR